MSTFDWNEGGEEQKRGLQAGFDKIKTFNGQDKKKVIAQLQDLFKRAESAQKDAGYKTEKYYYWLGYKNAIREALAQARGK